jgi:microsomal dipeptidase-like Zn-dependent dipeptidase
MPIPETVRRFHHDALVIDAHVHPSLKTYLFKKKLWKSHKSGGAFNPFTMRVDLPKSIAGGVDAFVSSVYLPERGLLDDCKFLKIASKVGPKRMRRLFKGDPLDRTLEILDDFEKAVVKANARGRELARIVRSTDELIQANAEGVIAVVHAVEGGHSLGGRPESVELLSQRGVCMLTLAHFYSNDVVSPVVGIPEDMQKLGCFKQQKDLTKGLGPIGPAVIEEMLRVGMIIDLTHCTPVARTEIYDLCGTRRPLIFSHVGVQPLADDPMSPTEEEINRIAATGGVVAVIFMNYWLGEHDTKNGLEAIVETAKQIAAVGGVDSVAFGSDFDGFTDPPDDIKDAAQMPSLTEALLEEFSEPDVEKILGKNMERVLREGWR